jgi:phosphoserine phosphatase
LRLPIGSAKLRRKELVRDHETLTTDLSCRPLTRAMDRCDLQVSIGTALGKPATQSHTGPMPMITCAVGPASAVAFSADPLPSWNDTAAKEAVLSFVSRVSRPGSADFVPVSDRLATFDHDGTLWPERPLRVQALFLVDRVKALAALPQREWLEQTPFRELRAGNIKAAGIGSERAIVELVAATHTGMTTEEFERIVLDWIAAAKHPHFGRPYTDLAYRPMLELLEYLRANGFRTYIVTGGDVEFLRPWVRRVYGVAPEQVVGSSIKTRLELRRGNPALVRLAEADFIDNSVGKAASIHRFIAHRPLIACGNSDDDLQMMQWTTAAPGPRMGLLLRHTDASREWAYDRAQSVSWLDEALEEAKLRGWIVIDMHRDWNRIFAFEQ